MKLNAVLNNKILSVLIFILFIFINILLHIYLQPNIKHKNYTQDNNPIIEQSYSSNKLVIEDIGMIVDPNKIEYINFEDKPISNITISVYIIMFIYTIILITIFLYREKQYKIKISNVEELITILQESNELNDNKKDTFETMKKSLLAYKKIIEPEFSFEHMSSSSNSNLRSLLVSSRVALEKVLLIVYQDQLNSKLSPTLNEIIKQLKLKNIINNSMNNYAHIIKAFGNDVLHPNLDKNKSPYKESTVLLVLSALSELLREMENKNLLREINVNS